MEKEKRIGKGWKIIILFFAIMLGCTIVSRVADSLTVPKVKIGNVKTGELNFTVDGEGYLAGESETILFLPSDVKIVSAIQVGTVVQNGDVLAEFDQNALEERTNSCQMEIKKLQLQLEQEVLNGQPSVWTREQDSALRNLNKIDAEIGALQTVLEQKKAEYEHRTADENLSEEEKQQLEAGITDVEQQLAGQWESRSAAQEALETAKSNDAATEQNNQRQQKLAELSKESLQIDIKEKQEELDDLEQLMENGGKFISTEAGTVTETTVTVGSLTGGTEYFKLGSGNSKLTADVSGETAEGLKENDPITVTSQDGKKEAKGVVTSVSQKNGMQNSMEHTNSDDTGEILLEMTAQLDENEFSVGEKVYFKAVRKSQEYKCVIPLSAIREDNDGQYVLVLEDKNSILGKEQIAARMIVKVLEKNDSEAAVESTLTKEDQIITSSNKTIKAGDRVRVD